MRSTFGRSRVTQMVRPCGSGGGSFDVSTSGRPAAFQASKPPSATSAGTPACRSHAATPWLSFWPFWQSTMAERPASSAAQLDTFACVRRTEPGTRRGSSAKSSTVRTSTSTGDFGVPTRRASFSMEIVLIDDMMRPPVHGTRCFGMSPRGEIAVPRSRNKGARGRIVKAGEFSIAVILRCERSEPRRMAALPSTVILRGPLRGHLRMTVFVLAPRCAAEGWEEGGRSAFWAQRSSFSRQPAGCEPAGEGAVSPSGAPARRFRTSGRAFRETVAGSPSAQLLAPTRSGRRRSPEASRVRGCDGTRGLPESGLRTRPGADPAPPQERL